MFLYEIYPRWRYAWLWKLMISWDKGVTVGYYPDWLNCRWEWRVW